MIGPVPCQGCRRPVHWNGFRWIDTLKGRQHVCPKTAREPGR